MSIRPLPILIIGAGCAGLSLAVHLVRSGHSARVVIVDPRTEFVRDRTWCGFATRPDVFDDCIDHRWHKWRIRSGDRVVETGSSAIAYTHRPADAVYRSAVEQIRSAANVELLLGVNVQKVHPAGDHVDTELSQGRGIRAAMVFDSRPPALGAAQTAPGDVCLYQQFVGLHVRSASPVFDPAVVDMMDFRVAQHGSIRFAYVLPYCPHEALVEITAFSPTIVPFAQLAACAHDYLSRQLGVMETAVVHREQGIIPMTSASFDTRPHPRLMRIGLAGAAAKPSTGYAFSAIQHASAQIAQSLSVATDPSHIPTPVHRDRFGRFLDDVFLSYLNRFPGRAPALFQDIFSGCNPESLARFLTDTGSLADAARVIAAMPKAPFVLEAVRSNRVLARVAARLALTEASCKTSVAHKF